MSTSYTALDFDDVRIAIREYLRSQTTFKDYDFEGSGMTVLINLLAYVTHYNGYYANMVANEAFIDTAQRLGSIISIAKHLGYTPRSIRASKAKLKVNFGPGSGSNPPSTVTALSNVIARGSVFTVTTSARILQFTALDSYTITRNTTTNDWEVASLLATEGALRSTSYLVDTTQANEKYVLPNANIDVSTLVVRVQAGVSDTSGFTDTWTKVTDINQLTPNSKIYFLEANENGTYSIRFGDGVLGQKPTNGNLVYIEYVETLGAAANDVGSTDSASNRVFSYVDSPSAVVSVLAQSSGGSDPETIESIRTLAPRAFQSQLRSVTKDDYLVSVLQNVPGIESAFVWGGEQNVPPQYGKVFISLKPTGGLFFSTEEKNTIIESYIRPNNIVGVIPELVDPEYTYLLVDSTVKYDPSKTVEQAAGIESLVRSVIGTFATSNLDKFLNDFRYSVLISQINDADTSVLSNQTSVRMQKRFTPPLNTNTSYTLEFNNPIYHPREGYSSVVTSTPFVYFDSAYDANYTSYLEDDGYGVLRIYRMLPDGSKRIVESSVGTVSYSTGSVFISSLTIVSLGTLGEVRVYCIPNTQDLTPAKNQIFVIDSQDILGESIVVRTLTGSTTTFNGSSGTGFPYSSGIGAG